MGFKSFEVEKSEACKYVCSLMANPLLDDFILVSAVLYIKCSFHFEDWFRHLSKLYWHNSY